MCQITMDLPDDALLALKSSRETIANEMRLAAAMKWFELGKLSSGAAARFAGVPRVVFLSKLADFGIDTFRVTEEELRQEERLLGSCP